MRAWISLAVLLAVVSGLGAWLYYKPRTAETAAYALSELKRDDVQRVRIERVSAGESPPSESAAPKAPGAAIEIERTSAGWRLTSPAAARADAAQVERLLAILDTRSSVRYGARELERYGLDAPAVKLTLNGETFAFGAVNTVTREQYVLTRGAVYAIPLTQRTAIPRDPDALVSRALFAPLESPVRFELPAFTAALENGTWSFTPGSDNVDADERNAWADAWRHATALRAAPHDGRAAAARINVRLKDERVLVFEILQLEPELVLLRPDEGIQYFFLADSARRLLSPPRARNQ